MAKPDSALLAAYRKTVYRVFNRDASIAFSIGTTNDALGTLLQDNGVATGSLITAWNPASEPGDMYTNQSANARLRAEIDSIGYAWLPAEGCDPDGVWPCEESLLVLGLSREATLDLCARYGQYAVVWVGTNGVPALLLADGTILS